MWPSSSSRVQRETSRYRRENSAHPTMLESILAVTVWGKHTRQVSDYKIATQTHTCVHVCAQVWIESCPKLFQLCHSLLSEVDKQLHSSEVDNRYDILYICLQLYVHVTERQMCENESTSLILNLCFLKVVILHVCLKRDSWELVEAQRHLRELNIYKMIFIHGPSLG